MRKREGVEPRNNQRSTKTKGFIFWKSELVYANYNGDVYIEVAGSKSVAGRRKRFISELGRTKVFQRSKIEAE